MSGISGPFRLHLSRIDMLDVLDEWCLAAWGLEMDDAHEAKSLYSRALLLQQRSEQREQFPRDCSAADPNGVLDILDKFIVTFPGFSHRPIDEFGGQRWRVRDGYLFRKTLNYPQVFLYLGIGV